MKTLVIGFSAPRGRFKVFSWIIRLVERTSYSHVYVRAHSDSLDVDLIYQASGTQVNFMGLELFRTHAQAKFEFAADLDPEIYRRFMQWAIINAGADYSLKQALGILFVKMFNLKKNPLGNGQRGWVCSELAGYVLDSFIGVHIDQSELDYAGPKKIFELCQKHLAPLRLEGE